MPLTIIPAKKQDITKIVCPDCKERLRNVGLKKESKIDGLTFKCNRCDKLWEIKSE